MADDFKYHIDHHGSLVRPAALQRARDAHADGELDDAGLAAAVTTAAQDALLEQRRLGLLALSDGEFGRRNDLAVVYDAVDGFGASGGTSPIAELVGTALAPEVRILETTPVARGRLVETEGAFLRAVGQRATMVALPSPGYLAALNAPVGAVAGAGMALAEIVRSEVLALATDGVGYILLRNPAAAFLLHDQGRGAARSLGIDPDEVLAAMIEADGASIADLDVPENFRIGLDLTTGGQAKGGWDQAALLEFLANQAFGRLCVDFPEAPVERFPLDLAPEGLVMSLGVVDISDPEIEDVDALVARIDEAAAIVDIDDIAVSTNGGFHIGGPYTVEHGRAKLQRVEMVARYFWGNEL